MTKYEEWEEAEMLSPASPEASYAEDAWNCSLKCFIGKIRCISDEAVSTTLLLTSLKQESNRVRANRSRTGEPYETWEEETEISPASFEASCSERAWNAALQEAEKLIDISVSAESETATPGQLILFIVAELEGLITPFEPSKSDSLSLN